MAAHKYWAATTTLLALLVLLATTLLPHHASAADSKKKAKLPKPVSFGTPPWDSRFTCTYPPTVDLPASTVCSIFEGQQLILSDDNDVVSVRYSYKKKVQLYKRRTRYAASFSASYAINIDRDSERSVRRVFGGGIAFAITPTTDVGTSGPESFGLFEIDEATGASLRGTKTKTVAVAVDTSRSDASTAYDPEIPHIEVDVNSVKSVRSAFLWNQTDFIDRKVGVFVDYDARKEVLTVRVQNVTGDAKPDKAKSKLYLTYPNFKLSDYVNEKSYVAFSSRVPVTDDGIYRIYDWKFSTKWVRTNKVH